MSSQRYCTYFKQNLKIMHDEERDVALPHTELFSTGLCFKQRITIVFGFTSFSLLPAPDSYVPLHGAHTKNVSTSNVRRCVHSSRSFHNFLAIATTSIFSVQFIFYVTINFWLQVMMSPVFTSAFLASVIIGATPVQSRTPCPRKYSSSTTVHHKNNDCFI